MTIHRRLVFACLALGCCSAFAQEAPPSLYSFADLYRMTANAAPATPALVPSAPQFLTVAEPRVTAVVAAEPRFTIAPVPGPKGWMLLLAGLAAAGWVAHRRLTSAY